MHINVSQLLMEHSGSSRFYEVDEEFNSKGDAEVQSIRGTVKLLRTDQGVWVSVVLDSEVLCACSRCLQECRQPIHMVIEEEARLGLGSYAGGGGGHDPDEGLRIDRDHILDLTDTVSQYAALNQPMKPVCRDDCRGICPNCGADRNLFPCQCDSVARDSRWGDLLHLVPSNQSKEVDKA